MVRLRAVTTSIRGWGRGVLGGGCHQVDTRRGTRAESVEGIAALVAVSSARCPSGRQYSRSGVKLLPLLPAAGGRSISTLR
jgi:hypothetical protein